MIDAVLRQGFRVTHRHLSSVLLDVLWKLAWLILTLTGLFLVVVWFGSEFQSIEWVNAGNRAIDTAKALELLRELWIAKRSAILDALGMVLVLSTIVWFVLEAAIRSKLGNASFFTFLLSNILKCLFIGAAALILAAICFGRFFSTPIWEWRQLWVDTRGPVIIAVLTIGLLGFLLTIFDTLVRTDAVELLGTDLFRVAGLIGILLLFETMISAACAVMLGTGLLNVTGLNNVLTMLGAIAIGIGLLNVLHSYLLLVRYSAISTLRQDVSEI
jgi:hypothetical protein